MPLGRAVGPAGSDGAPPVVSGRESGPVRSRPATSEIPDAPGQWEVTVRGAPKLAATLCRGREAAELFLELATLRVDRSLLRSVAELEWPGPTDRFGVIAERLGAPQLLARARALAVARG